VGIFSGRRTISSLCLDVTLPIVARRIPLVLLSCFWWSKLDRLQRRRGLFHSAVNRGLEVGRRPESLPQDTDSPVGDSHLVYQGQEEPTVSLTNLGKRRLEFHEKLRLCVFPPASFASSSRSSRGVRLGRGGASSSSQKRRYMGTPKPAAYLTRFINPGTVWQCSTREV